MTDYSLYLLKRFDEDRTAKDNLCDYYFCTSKQSFPVHKSVVGVVSNFFKKLFLSYTNKPRNFFEFPRNVSAETLELTIDYTYGNKIVLSFENAYQLLEVAAYLEIVHLQHYCTKYLIENLSIDCALETWQYASKYDNFDFLNKCESFISKNMRAVFEQKRYLSFDIENFTKFLKMKANLNMQETIYECVMDWISHDKLKRRKYFKDLYKLINVDKLADPYYNFVVLPEKMRPVYEEATSNKDSISQPVMEMESQGKFVKNINRHNIIPPYFNDNKHRYHAEVMRKRARIHEKIRDSLKATPFTPHFAATPSAKKQSNPKMNSKSTNLRAVVNADEFIVVGGASSPCSIKKCNVFTKNWTIYPNLESRVCVDVGLAFSRKSLFVLGGRSKDLLEVFDSVHSVEFNDSTHECKEMASMKTKRFKFGCITLDHKIFIAGGFNLRGDTLNSVESYSIGKNEWEIKSNMISRRGGCCLIGFGGVLYAIGGRDKGKEYHRSVEIFNGAQWKMCLPMIVRRSELAAVELNGRIYAIGGRSSENCFNGSVERRDPGSWKYVSRLNVPRSGHSACVLDGKIYVLGGVNSQGAVKTMEVYDPKKDSWEIFGDLIGDPVGATMISTSVELYK